MTTGFEAEKNGKGLQLTINYISDQSLQCIFDCQANKPHKPNKIRTIFQTSGCMGNVPLLTHQFSLISQGDLEETM